MVDTNMTFTLLSSRCNNVSDVMFTLSFNVSFGPPSMIRCVDGNEKELFVPEVSRGTAVKELSSEVIRSHYINSSYPDTTHVTLTQTSPRQRTTYTCTVTVEGCVNINNNNYNFANKGSGNATASITGECVADVLKQEKEEKKEEVYPPPPLSPPPSPPPRPPSPPPPPPSPPLSCRHPHWCHCHLDWLYQC